VKVGYVGAKTRRNTIYLVVVEKERCELVKGWNILQTSNLVVRKVYDLV
jgi:hypothetical protein